jgi:hypothetical protein
VSQDRGDERIKEHCKRMLAKIPPAAISIVLCGATYQVLPAQLMRNHVQRNSREAASRFVNDP